MTDWMLTHWVRVLAVTKGRGNSTTQLTAVALTTGAPEMQEITVLIEVPLTKENVETRATGREITSGLTG